MCYQKTAAWAAWQHDTFDLNGLNRRGARLWGLFAAEERAKGENEGDGENVGRSFQIGDRAKHGRCGNARGAKGGTGQEQGGFRGEALNGSADGRGARARGSRRPAVSRPRTCREGPGSARAPAGISSTDCEPTACDRAGRRLQERCSAHADDAADSGHTCAGPPRSRSQSPDAADRRRFQAAFATRFCSSSGDSAAGSVNSRCCSARTKNAAKRFSP